MLTSRANGGRSETSLPASSTLPASGCSKPAISRSVVVLPEPDGPSSVKNSPRAHVEVDAVDGRDVAVALDQAAQPDVGRSVHERAHYSPVWCPRVQCRSLLYVQRDQPQGVPPLSLTGERTLPDVPEENYWFQRHLAVYEWIAARAHGRRVVDLACGEGYGSAVLARTAASVVGVDANPEAFEHARLKYTATACGSSATCSSCGPGTWTASCSCRRSSTSRTPTRCWSTCAS